MATAKQQLLTADDLLRLSSQGVRGELIRGVLYETMPTGRQHGKILANLTGALISFVKPKSLGSVEVGDVGVWLERDPDTVRAPDIAFFSPEKDPPEEIAARYAEVVPDLLAEIVSPNDTPREVREKAEVWLGFGVGMVWVVNPDTRTVDVHRRGLPIITLTDQDALDGLDILPGFTCPVSEVFNT
jgi:Uma2 family endonuclease